MLERIEYEIEQRKDNATGIFFIKVGFWVRANSLGSLLMPCHFAPEKISLTQIKIYKFVNNFRILNINTEIVRQNVLLLLNISCLVLFQGFQTYFFSGEFFKFSQLDIFQF